MIYLNPSTTCQELISSNLTALSKQAFRKKINAIKLKILENFIYLIKAFFILTHYTLMGIGVIILVNL